MNSNDKQILRDRTNNDFNMILNNPSYLLNKYKLLSDEDKKEIIFTINLSLMLSENSNINRENKVIQFPDPSLTGGGINE